MSAPKSRRRARVAERPQIAMSGHRQLLRNVREVPQADERHRSKD